MTFLALIIAVVLLQVWGTADAARHDNWFSYWRARVQSWGLQGWPSFLVLVLVPVLGAVLLLDLLRPVLFGLLWIAVAAGLLLYSFGRSDFATLVERYCQCCLRGDFEAAWLSLNNELATTQSIEAPADAMALHQEVQLALPYEGYQRWFAVVFYFLLLGPAAALAYRLLQMAEKEETAGMARQCLVVADWLPARVLALTFALAGDFVGSREALTTAAPGSGVPAAHMLRSVSASALGGLSVTAETTSEALPSAASAETRELAALLTRSAASWLIIASLMELLL